jgi:hypothetical protein
MIYAAIALWATFMFGLWLGIFLGRRQVDREAKTAALVRALTERQQIPFPALDRGCKLPIPGWICTREPGHSGPCAAVQRPKACIDCGKPCEDPAFDLCVACDV